ncbi:SDR family oxidoreductase [Rhodococcus jostii]|uniref:SDR family oxidoreductase n=1 Tax=Rhodococcus jostii TaxID=132919 RepID=UPI003644C112
MSRAMKPGGSLVNISSMNGIVGGAGVSAYRAGKFAIRGITRSAAPELATAQIRGNSVHPGAVSTPKIGSISTTPPTPTGWSRQCPSPATANPRKSPTSCSSSPATNRANRQTTTPRRAGSIHPRC